MDYNIRRGDFEKTIALNEKNGSARLLFYGTMVHFFSSPAKLPDDANGTQKLHSRFLNKFAIISTRLFCVMWANCRGAETRWRFRRPRRCSRPLMT